MQQQLQRLVDKVLREHHHRQPICTIDKLLRPLHYKNPYHIAYIQACQLLDHWVVYRVRPHHFRTYQPPVHSLRLATIIKIRQTTTEI